jgi:long-chain acyl-CoA synthetase
MPGVQCRILDPSTGLELTSGEQGEIVLKSLGNFLGYWNQPEKTAETLREGWVHTGDIGKIDNDGYLTLSGRIKELIKVSGYSVFPEDVEALLREHPDIQQVAVTGFADPSKGEVVKAFIVLRPGRRDVTTAESLITWSRENMSAYKVPRYVEFLDELPTTASGKVMRRLL